MPLTTTIAGCGHSYLPRGSLPGVAQLPRRAGTMCYPCADEAHRRTLADPHVISYRALLNGETIVSPTGGRLAGVTYRRQAPSDGQLLDQLWVTDTRARVWTTHIDTGVSIAPIVLHDNPNDPIPDECHHVNPSLVHPGDTLTVWDLTAKVVTVAHDGPTVSFRSVYGPTTAESIPWAAVSAHQAQPCCIGPRVLCRCVNGVTECPMPGCNARATAWIDRHETYDGTKVDTWSDKVCTEHFQVLIAIRGWSTPARGVAE